MRNYEYGEMKKYDFIVIGAGIFGVTTAVELAKKKFQVAVLNPDSIPHPRAASTDISKVVRMEYGPDREYADMCERSIEVWKEWNELFQETLYHEVGLLIAMKEALEAPSQTYARQNIATLEAKGYKLQYLDTATLKERFPAWNTEVYPRAIFNPCAGYAEAGRAVGKLAEYAQQLGVHIFEGQTAERFLTKNHVLEAVQTKEGETYACGHAIVCAGAHTPYLLPELHPYMKSTGHAIYHLLPSDPTLFSPPNFSVYMADVSNTGWYGFPFHQREGVVKAGHHSDGLAIHPDRDDRVIKDQEIDHFRSFLKATFPDLVDAPITYTRRCLYTDTKDGHFWIDQHPEMTGLTIGTGGSGHGFKMGPELGKMIAATALGQQHAYSDRYKWREFSTATRNMEASRHQSE